MLKKQLRFMPIHMTFCGLLLFGTFVGTRGTIPYDPLEAWRLFVVFYFPLATIGNLMVVFKNKGEPENYKAFVIALPIMFLPFLILLPILFLF